MSVAVFVCGCARVSISGFLFSRQGPRITKKGGEEE